MKNKIVLVVDDSRVSRMMIKSIINNTQPDWTIIEAGNGDEALAATETTHVDLMIIDYNMPGIDGLTLAEKLKQRFPSAIISLLTANIQSSIEKKAIDLGVSFDKKPITEEKIKNILLRTS